MKLTNQRPRTDQEDTEAQTGDDNKVQTSGEKHQEARGKVSLGQEDFRVRRSERRCQVQSGVRESLRRLVWRLSLYSVSMAFIDRIEERGKLGIKSIVNRT